MEKVSIALGIFLNILFEFFFIIWMIFEDLKIFYSISMVLNLSLLIINFIIIVIIFLKKNIKKNIIAIYFALLLFNNLLLVIKSIIFINAGGFGAFAGLIFLIYSGVLFFIFLVLGIIKFFLINKKTSPDNKTAGEFKN